jgi:hypothetical protein
LFARLILLARLARMPLGARHRLAFAALLFTACGSSTIDSHDYPGTCTADSDCALVYSGDTCAFCQCGNSGIRAAELPRYQSDYNSKKSSCPKNTPPVDCVPCVNQVAFCLGGECSSHAQ